jgi:hypothetical protein
LLIRWERLFVAQRGFLLGASWVAYGIVGAENQVFLAVMVTLSIVLAGVATFVVRVRKAV